MNHQIFKTAPSTVRSETLVIGLLIAAFLMARSLPASSSPEFWTELFTGTGLLFVLYGAPYVIFFFLFRKAVNLRVTMAGGAVILALGVAMIAVALIPKGLVRPEDVSIFDPSALLVFIQVAVTLVLASLAGSGR